MWFRAGSTGTESCVLVQGDKRGVVRAVGMHSTWPGPGGAALPGDVEKKARVFALLPCLKWAHGSRHLMVRSFWNQRDFLEGACHSPGHVSREQRPPPELSCWPCCSPWTMHLLWEA